MAARYQTTVYSEIGRKITVSIKDKDFSGAVTNFDTTSLQLQYDSESNQGSERFTPIIGSSLQLSLLINTDALQTLLVDIGFAIEGRFTIQMTTFESDNTTPLYYWYGYIITDLVEFEDVPVSLGFIAQIKAVDGIAWLKTLLYKSEVGPYLGQDTVVQHICNSLNQLDFVQENLVANSLPILQTVFNWNENSIAYSADNDFALRTVISHRAFYHRDTKNNYTYQSCYDVLKKICQTFGARLIFSGNQYWFIQVNEYNNNPASHRYFKYNGFGVQSSGTNTLDFTISNSQNDIVNSDLIRLSGGRWSFYSALKNVVIKYNYFGKQNLLAGKEYIYATNATPEEVTIPTLDSTNVEARLSYTGILNYYAAVIAPAVFEPFQLIFAVKLVSIINSFPLQGFLSANWTLGAGWTITDKILSGLNIGTEAFYTTFSVVSGRKYFVNIKVKFDNAGTLRLRLGGVTKTITEAGDYEYIIESINTNTLKLDSTSTPLQWSGQITSLQVKQENKWLKRNINYLPGFNFTLDPASWESSSCEYIFNTDTSYNDLAFVVNKTISFDTLDIPETAEYVWSMRLKEITNEAGATITNNYAISYTINNNYLEFLPSGSIGGQADIEEYGSDNDDKSSVIFDLDTFLGDGISANTNGALKVLEDAGTFKLSNTWDVSSGQGFNSVTQLLVNEVIKGQLRPVSRMVDMPFQNLSVNNPYLPHKVIEYSSGYYVFERGSFDMKTDTFNGDFFKIDY